MFTALVSSTLLYGSGSWTRQELDTNQLETTQNHLSTLMLGSRPTDQLVWRLPSKNGDVPTDGNGRRKEQLCSYHLPMLRWANLSSYQDWATEVRNEH